MKQHHAHNSLMILGASVFILTTALYVYMYLAVNSQTARVVSARTEQAAQELDAKQLGDLKTLLKHSEPAREKLSNIFVQKDDVVKFIESIEALNVQTGAKVEIGSVGDIKSDASNIGKFTAYINATGSWSQVYKVLVLLETMQKSVTVDSVRLNTQGSADGKLSASSWGLSLNVTANTIQ